MSLKAVVSARAELLLVSLDCSIQVSSEEMAIMASYDMLGAKFGGALLEAMTERSYHQLIVLVISPASSVWCSKSKSWRRERGIGCWCIS